MKKVKLIRQTIVTECGVCSLAMVAAYYGYKQTISFYRNKFSIGRDGTTVKELYDMFASFGMEVNVYRCEKIDDYDYKGSIPYIIFCKNSHFSVVQKTKKGFLLSNPASDQKYMKPEEFEDLFGGIVVEAIPTENFRKMTANIGDFRHVKRIVKNNAKLLILSLVFSVLAYGAAILVPIFLKNIIDVISDRGGPSFDFSSVLLKILGLIVLYAGTSLARNKIGVSLEASMSDNVSKGTMLHLLRIPYSFFDNRSPGNILYRLAILDSLKGAVASQFVETIINTTNIICVYLYIVLSFPTLAIPITVLLVITGAYILLIAKKQIELQKENLKASESVSDLRTEIINNVFQIKSLHLENYFWGNFVSRFESYLKTFKKESHFSMFTSLGIVIINTFSPVLIILLFIASQESAITAGNVILVYSLLTMFTGDVTSFFSSITSLFQIKSIVFYLNDMLDEPEQISDGHAEISRFESLEIENATFSYSKRSAKIVQDLNLVANRGEKIGIVGLTGSGKTTIVKLLTGLYEPNVGTITINGIALIDLDPARISGLVTVVPQMPIVFNKDIRDNITLNDESISDEAVYEALECACFLEDVLKMPLGLNTYISGQGGNLSGGQIQRLALARALVRRPQLLIMDESTSSLDASTENRIYQNLKKLDITTIVISHRLSTVVDADRLYFIEPNTPVVSGNHAWMLEHCEPYRDLFSQQLGPNQNDAEENEEELNE